MTRGITKEEIWDILTRPDDPNVDRQSQRGMHAVGRALVAIESRQHLRHRMDQSRSGAGFTSYDSIKGGSMAQFYATHGYLTVKQYKWWLSPDSRGHPRICKYWPQLKIIADHKAKHRAERLKKYLPDQLDLFDSDEILMDRNEAIEKARLERAERNAEWRRMILRETDHWS